MRDMKKKMPFGTLDHVDRRTSLAFGSRLVGVRRPAETVLGLARGRRAAPDAPAMPAAEGGASGGARSAAVGAGSPVTPPAATAICSENTTLDGFVHKILSSEPFLMIIAVLKS